MQDINNMKTKREYKKKYKELDRMLFPNIFWKLCSSCKNEFRFQRGWQAITGPYYGGFGRFQYLCIECAPIREDADNFFIHEKWNFNKPIKPPPERPKARKIIEGKGRVI